MKSLRYEENKECYWGVSASWEKPKAEMDMKEPHSMTVLLDATKALPALAAKARNAASGWAARH